LCCLVNVWGFPDVLWGVGMLVVILSGLCGLIKFVILMMIVIGDLYLLVIWFMGWVCVFVVLFGWCYWWFVWFVLFYI